MTTQSAGRSGHAVLTRLGITSTIVASLGGFMFGYDTAVINGTVDAMKAEFGIGTALVGAILAAALFGAALGASTSGVIVDRLGRRPAMLIASSLFVVSATLSGLAHAGIALAGYRLLGGYAVGMASVVGPLYIAETAPTRLRGRLASAQQMSIVLGIFAALLCNALLANLAGGAQGRLAFGLPAWRWMFLSAAVPSLVYGLTALTIPESPRFLVLKGRTDRAAQILVRLHRVSEPESWQNVSQIMDSLGAEGPRGRLTTRPGRLKPIVWLGIALAALQALVGIDVIFYYSTSLWASVGFGEQLAFWLSTFTSLVNVAATVVAILLIDRVGRRSLLLVGSAGMVLSLALMALGFSHAGPTGDGVRFTGSWGVITLVAANLFVIAFAVSWGPVVWVLLGEMFPNSIRARAAAVAAGANWVAGIVVNLTFPTLREISLSGSYALYATFAVVSFLVVFFALPETTNRPLEEMDSGLARHRPS